ncbi:MULTISPECIES: GNAT family N-acetyltransferase [Dickeya]|uniref:GNAT family N-acetyltransferase n=1 Tax=Dickeya TaxID=204037 RepID=UPI00031EE2EA|nr:MULTISPECIES: GNAT family N-acetyltransferase [Dickeya]AJC65836.1 acetyltransferase [Dickeya zeae EC1]
MKEIRLIPVTESEKVRLFRDVQNSFQSGFEAVFGECAGTILPEQDIEYSFSAPNAESYFAILDGEVVGGAIITVNKKSGINHLDFLYVNAGCQNHGVGMGIWKNIERLHPETKVWETHTPYFDKRNIHFYINKLGFHIVEFYNARHKDPNYKDVAVEETRGDIDEDLFRFEKVMR